MSRVVILNPAEFNENIKYIVLVMITNMCVIRDLLNVSLEDLDQQKLEFYHHENTPILIHRKFHLQKLKIIR